MFSSPMADAEILVHLKSGIKVRGEVEEETDEYIRIKTNFGVSITYFTEEILNIIETDVDDVEENDIFEDDFIRAKLPVEPHPIAIHSPRRSKTIKDTSIPKIDIYEVIPELIKYDLPAFREANPRKAKIFYDKGVAAAENKKHMIAKLNFLKSVNADPDFVDGYYNLGLICGLLEQYDEAIHYLGKARVLEPKSADIFYALGVAHNAFGQVNDAQTFFTKAINIRPKFFEAYYKLGVIYAVKEKYFMARQNLRKAVEIEPQSLKVHFQLGMVLAAMGSDNAAITSFKKVIEINPDFPDAYYNLGVMYAEIDQYDKAIDQFQVAVVKGSQNPDAFFNLGMAHLGRARNSVTIGTLGAYKKARINLERAKELYSTDTDYDTIQKIDEVLIEILLY